MDPGDTIIGDSNVGKRLQRLPKSETLQLSYGGQSFPIVTQLTMGRERENSIQVEDSLVSRHHAVVQRIGDAFFVKDLGSTNGTYVNGKRIPDGKYARLRRGDTVKIGRTEISIS